MTEGVITFKAVVIHSKAAWIAEGRMERACRRVV